MSKYWKATIFLVCLPTFTDYLHPRYRYMPPMAADRIARVYNRISSMDAGARLISGWGVELMKQSKLMHPTPVLTFNWFVYHRN